MTKKVISKVLFNKKTGQMMIFPSKKKTKALNPTIKFGDDLFVKLQFHKKVK